MKYVIPIFDCSKLITSNTTDIHVPINTFYYQYRDLNSVLLRIFKLKFLLQTNIKMFNQTRMCVNKKLVYTNIQSYS